MHPATLNVAFQSFIGAYTALGDRRLRSLLVPTGIARIALNPWVADRITYWYIKSFIASLEPEDRARAPFHFVKHIQWCEHQLAEAKAGRNIW
jgi:hypothetical protein